MCNNFTISDFDLTCGSNGGGLTAVIFDLRQPAASYYSSYTDTGDFAPAYVSALNPTGTPSGVVVLDSFNDYASGWTSNGNYNATTNTNLVTNETTIVFNTVSEMKKFDNMRASRPVIWTRDRQGKWTVTGFFYSNVPTASTSQTGLQLTDAANKSITFTETSIYSPVSANTATAAWLDGLAGF